jgi:hypothetical protein
MEKTLKIDETHSRMCKFDSANDVYEPVGRQIGGLYEQAKARATAMAMAIPTGAALAPPPLPPLAEVLDNSM